MSTEHDRNYPRTNITIDPIAKLAYMRSHVDCADLSFSAFVSGACRMAAQWTDAEYRDFLVKFCGKTEAEANEPSKMAAEMRAEGIAV